MNMVKRNDNQNQDFSGISRREFLKGGAGILILAAVGGNALNLVGCGKVENEFDTGDFHKPYDNEIVEVNSPWYVVEGSEFRITDKDGANVRWNPVYEAIGRPGDTGQRSTEYYGTLNSGKKFQGVNHVIKSGSYKEDVYDDDGKLLGYEEKEYIGISADDFLKNLSDDDSLRHWMEERVGLSGDDVVFIASGKTNIKVGEVSYDMPEYHRDAS